MNLTLFLIQFGVIIFSVVLHEVAHGYVARERGDHTAERAGRLTLDPRAHIDPFGTIFLPMLLLVMSLPIIGWAKPVPVRPAALRNPRHDWMIVSLAGPATNLAIAVFAALPLRLGIPVPTLLAQTLVATIAINISLAVFNLIPIPPLDGSRVVMRFLPPRALEAYLRLEGTAGMIVLYVLLAIGVIGSILGPIVSFLTNRALGLS